MDTVCVVKSVSVVLKTDFVLKFFGSNLCKRGNLRVKRFYINISKSNRKAMNRNWSNQKGNPALKTKREIIKYCK